MTSGDGVSINTKSAWCPNPYTRGKKFSLAQNWQAGVNWRDLPQATKEVSVKLAVKMVNCFLCTASSTWMRHKLHLRWEYLLRSPVIVAETAIGGVE